jgi:hypothetical protein
MKWRRISESEVLEVLENPDRIEPSVESRRNAYKSLDDRFLKVTYVDENGDAVVITAIEKDRT